MLTAHNYWENALEFDMFTGCNLRHAIDLQRLCCSMAYVSVM